MESNFFVHALKDHEGYKYLRNVLQEEFDNYLLGILSVKNDQDILFAVSNARAMKNQLSKMDHIIEQAGSAQDDTI